MGPMLRARVDAVIRTAPTSAGLAPEPGLSDRRVVACGFPDPEEESVAESEQRWYDPLDGVCEVLHRFVTMDCAEDDQVVHFYNDFGALGYEHDPRVGEELPDEVELGGEPVWWLTEQQQQIRLVLTVYDAWQNGNTNLLRDVFGQVPRGSPVRLAGSLGWIADEEARLLEYPDHPLLGHPSERQGPVRTTPPLLHFPPPTRDLTDEECQDYARLYVLHRLHEGLAGVRRQVLVPTAREGWGAVRPAHLEHRLVDGWQCRSLLDALYLRVANIATGFGQLRRCPECGDFFDPPLRRPGRPKLYCGQQCSVRHRQKEFVSRHRCRACGKQVPTGQAVCLHCGRRHGAAQAREAPRKSAGRRAGARKASPPPR